MRGRLRDWLNFPRRRPGLALVGALALGLAVFLLWLGARVVWFHRAWGEAEKALTEYDFPEARRRLAECVRLRPNTPAVRLLAAQAARRDGDLEAAEAELDRCDRLTRLPTAESKLERKLLRAQYGQVEQVVGELIPLIEARHPATEQILEALATGCVRVYHLERARFWTRMLLERFPKNPTGRLTHAQTLETLGNRDRAFEVLRELVREDPGRTKARQHLADSLFRARQDEEAAAHYEELLRRQPGELAPLLGLARSLHRLDKIDDARPLMKRLEQEHPNESEALLECGRFALREDRLADAERLYRRAAELAPNDHEAHLGLAVCLQQLGKSDEARQEQERGKQIEADLARLEKVVGAMMKAPNDPAPRLEAGQICLRNGQVAEGLRWLYGVLELAPNHAQAHQVLADHYASQGDGSQADYHRNRASGIGSFTPRGP
jgi:predicted Zn-dependent protease